MLPLPTSIIGSTLSIALLSTKLFAQTSIVTPVVEVPQAAKPKHSYEEGLRGSYILKGVKLSKALYQSVSSEPTFRALEALVIGDGYPAPSVAYWRSFPTNLKTKNYINSLDSRISYTCQIDFFAQGQGENWGVLYTDNLSCQPESSPPVTSSAPVPDFASITVKPEGPKPVHSYAPSQPEIYLLKDVKLSQAIYQSNLSEPTFRALEALVIGEGYPRPSAAYWRTFPANQDMKDYVNSLDSRLSYTCQIEFSATGSNGAWGVLYADRLSCQDDGKIVIAPSVSTPATPVFAKIVEVPQAPKPLHSYRPGSKGSWDLKEVRISKALYESAADDLAFRALEATVIGDGYPGPSVAYWRTFATTPALKEYVNSLDSKKTYSCRIDFFAQGSGDNWDVLYAEGISCVATAKR